MTDRYFVDSRNGTFYVVDGSNGAVISGGGDRTDAETEKGHRRMTDLVTVWNGGELLPPRDSGQHPLSERLSAFGEGKPRKRRSHAPTEKPPYFVTVTCAVCGLEATRKYDTVRYRRAHGQVDVCSTVCAWTAAKQGMNR